MSAYQHDGTYYADKTGLDTTQLKSCITMIVGANISGTDKLLLLVIGKSKNPKAFRNVTVPEEYQANKKAKMNLIIFENWLRNLDK